MTKKQRRFVITPSPVLMLIGAREMFLSLLKKELLSHILSLRFSVACALCILLIVASVFVTTREYQRDVAQCAIGAAASADQLAEIMKEKTPEMRYWRIFRREGRRDVIPTPPLSSIGQGLRSYMPVVICTRTGRSIVVKADAGRTPLARLFRMPDLIYIVSVVLSLVAILFGFDAVSGEKESGTLRLMLSNAVPRDIILLAKWFGGYLALIAPFLVAVVAGVGYAWWRGALAFTPENLVRFALLAVIACIYVSVFFSLSLVISSLTHRAVTTLFVCLLVWVLWILVIPNVAPLAAKITVPAPSPAKISSEKFAVWREIDSRREEAEKKISDPDELQREREKLEAEGERRTRQWDRMLEDAVSRQTTLAETLGRTSPLVCWTYAATAMTNTGPGAYKAFEAAQKRLAQEMMDFHIAYQQEREKTGVCGTFKLEEVPVLHVEYPDLRKSALSALTDVLILMIVSMAFFMGAFAAFLRYDVR